MATTPTPAPTTPTISYRAERIDTYAWQAYKTTTAADGTSTEVAIFKPDLIDIIMRKIGNAIKTEGQVGFHASKKKLA